MNRLQLAQRMRDEAGAISASAISSTTGQTGDTGRLVGWIDSAWMDIQQARLWPWMWEEATVTILTGTSKTAGTTPAERYVKDSAYNGTTPLHYLPWDAFRAEFPSVTIADGTPSFWTIDPLMALRVSAKPTSDFAIDLQWYTNPVAFAADADTPALPSEFHMLIVWRALQLYAGFDEAGGLYQHATANYKRMLRAATRMQAPDIELGGALV